MLYARSDPDGQPSSPRQPDAADVRPWTAAARSPPTARATSMSPGTAGPRTPAGRGPRRMWVARSKDDGATFSAEQPAFDARPAPAPAAASGPGRPGWGTLHLLYRAATGGTDRDMYLLSSADHAGHFRGESLHPWRAEVCPMSSESLAEPTAPGVLAAWETQGQVYFSRIDPRTHRAAPADRAAGRCGDRKHPAVAGNARGETIPRLDRGHRLAERAARWPGSYSTGRGARAGCRDDQGRRTRLGPGDRRRPARRRVRDHRDPDLRRACDGPTA